MRISLRRFAPLLLAPIVATCSETTTAPRAGSGRATLSIVPVFSERATHAKAMYDLAGLEINLVRLVIVRPPSETVKDTTVSYTVGQGNLTLDLNILATVGEPLTARIEYLAGQVVLYAGVAPVTAVSLLVPSSSIVPTQIVIEAVGPGSTAATVVVSPTSGVFPTTAPLVFTARAFTTTGTEIIGALFAWSVDDLTVASIDGTGTLQPTAKGGPLKVRATTLNQVFGEATVAMRGPAASLSLVSGGGQSAVAGSALAPIVVKVADANGRGVPNELVTFALATGGGSIVVNNGTTDASGLARATWTLGGTAGSQSITATRAGLTGSPLTVSATATVGAAAKLAFVTQPTNAVAGSVIAPAVQVTALDANDNVVTSFTGSITVSLFSSSSSAALGGTQTAAATAGVATFSNLAVGAAGTAFALNATSTGLTGATSSAFNVTPAPATSLQFKVQPSNAVEVSAISPSVEVKIVDALGGTVTTATNVVTLAIGTNPSSGSLSGTLSVAAVNGVAIFSGISINNVGNGYTLTAASTGLTGATSSAFNITAAPPTALQFKVQPLNAVESAAISPAIEVKIVNALGATVTTATSVVTLAIGTNPSSGSLSGTLSVAAVNGIATFSGVSINSVGNGYTLTAASTGLSGATSSAFNITAAPTTALQFKVQPANAVEAAAISPDIEVRIVNALGATVTTATNVVTLAIGTNPSSGLLSGTVSVAAVNGVATFSGVSINSVGNGYTLTAAST
ncbi:MAG: hypothetical protein ABIR92_03015, partial [Gemmatimonadaceae bacterium]